MDSQQALGEIVTRHPTELTPNPINANTHPPGQIDALVDSINRFGQPDLVSFWTAKVDTPVKDAQGKEHIYKAGLSYILGGHGVTEAFMRLDQMVRCVDLSHFSYDRALEWMEAANFLSLGSKRDTAQLAANMARLKESLPERMTALRASMEAALEAAGVVDLNGKEAPEDFQEYDAEIGTDFQCPKCNYEWSGQPR